MAAGTAIDGVGWSLAVRAGPDGRIEIVRRGNGNGANNTSSVGMNGDKVFPHKLPPVGQRIFLRVAPWGGGLDGLSALGQVP